MAGLGGRTRKGVFPTLRGDTKKCSMCDQWLSLDRFSKRPDRGGCGYQSRCNACHTSAMRGNPRRHQWSRNYRERYPFRKMATNLNMDARKRGSTVPHIHWSELMQRYNEVGQTCYICNLLIPESYVSFDHVVPMARGGKHDMGNLMPSHIGCNKAKNDLPLSEVLNWR